MLGVICFLIKRVGSPSRSFSEGWCIYTTPLELILSEIPEKIQSLRPAAKRRGFARGSRAKNFLP